MKELNFGIVAELAPMHDVEIENSDVESHYSLRVGKLYLQPLRDTYRKLKLGHPALQRQVLPAVAVRTMNTVKGPEGIATFVLMLGELPLLNSFAGRNISRAALAKRSLAA